MEATDVRHAQQLRQIVTRWEQAERDKEEKDYELLNSMLRKAGWRKHG